MKIIAFIYDFPHQKSHDGLVELFIHGYRQVKCIATPYKKLNIIPSKQRITPILPQPHPRLTAAAFNYEYVQCDHDVTQVLEHIEGYDVGVILGARIIKPFLVRRLPIINMHPGLIPENRGLDNIKWAIIHKMPQGVTSHLIDEKIDLGTLIDRQTIDIYYDDTILDVFLRLKKLEMKMMIEALEKYQSAMVNLHGGNYFKTVPDDLDSYLDTHFIIYKNRLGKEK